MKVFRNIVAALLSIAVMAGASAAPVGATGCKVITNPGMAFSEFWHTTWDPNQAFWAGFSGSLTTGDASSSCNDINISNIAGGACLSLGDAGVVVQYWANGGWVTDSAHQVRVPCNSSSLYVIGRGYANNATFRILFNLGSPNYPWPTFKLYV